MDYSYGRSLCKPPLKYYSEQFKKQVVREFERGGITKNALQRKYGIKGKSEVLKWCRKYGSLADYSLPAKNRPFMKDPQKRIRELEEKLKHAELKIKVYDKLIEVTNRELDADVLKKIEAELSRSLHQKNK